MPEIVLVPVDTEEGLRWRWRCEECRTLDDDLWVFPAAALDDAKGRHQCPAPHRRGSWWVEWGVEHRDDDGRWGIYACRDNGDADKQFAEKCERMPGEQFTVVSRVVDAGPWTPVEGSDG